MFRTIVFTFAILAGCAKSQPPAQTAHAPEPAPAAPQPAGETAPTPTTPAAAPAPAASNKCTKSGGKCFSKVAMNVCKRFEEGDDWGCGANLGCCL